MGRPVMLGNGQMLVGLDERGLVHDFYYPYVGQENLTTARTAHHMIGVWVDGKFSWLDENAWRIRVDFEPSALISSITALHPKLGVELRFSDFVDRTHNAFLRRITVKNTGSRKNNIRLFMHQVFQLSSYGRGDTVLYVPSGNYIYDYKGRTSLLVYAQHTSGEPFDQFAVGGYGIDAREGTFKDAEDGELSGNLVEHGSVDSVLRLCFDVEAQGEETADYWVVAANSQQGAEKVHYELLAQGLEARLSRCRSWWREWLEVSRPAMAKIAPEYIDIANKSLMVIKAHIDKRGGMIASCDSSIYNYNRDYYSYVWPRDAALSMLTLIELGYTKEPLEFFDFCADVMNPDGYMMHKYLADRSIGSTWHPLMHGRHPELAIQEDETAAVVYAIGRYHHKNGEAEAVAKLYHKFVAPAADFMANYIDEATGLPHASYDLWEERFASHTYTAAITQAALKEAVRLASHYGTAAQASRWQTAATTIDRSMKLLFNGETQAYRKSLLLLPSGDLEFNDTLDASSLYGVMAFDPDRRQSVALKQTAAAIEKKLAFTSPAGGVVRYENDEYFRHRRQYTGNPWLICTLWLAQYHIHCRNIGRGRELVEWVVKCATPSGMLPEQVDPEDGAQVGVAPLVWSHAELLNTLLLLSEEG